MAVKDPYILNSMIVFDPQEVKHLRLNPGIDPTSFLPRFEYGACHGITCVTAYFLFGGLRRG